MVRPTAAQLTVPLSRAKDLTPLASVLHVLGTRRRLESLQLLMDGPKLTSELPAGHYELQMLEDVGIITSERLPTGRVTYQWSLRPDGLARVAACLTVDQP